MAAMGSKSMQKAIIPEFRGIYVDQIANQVCALQIQKGFLWMETHLTAIRTMRSNSSTPALTAIRIMNSMKMVIPTISAQRTAKFLRNSYYVHCEQ